MHEAVLAPASYDQIDFAEKRINERLEEAREDLERPKKERLEKRQDAFVEAIEDWVGDIDEGQEMSLRSFVADLPDGLDIPAEVIARALQTFEGIKRRQEIRGRKKEIGINYKNSS